MSHQWWSSFSLKLSILTSLFVAGCDGHNSTNGRVVDENGKPIPDAEVELREAKEDGLRRSNRAMTYKDGNFHTGMTHAPMPVKLQVAVSKDGFVESIEPITSAPRNRDKRITVRLKKETGMTVTHLRSRLWQRQ